MVSDVTATTATTGTNLLYQFKVFRSKIEGEQGVILLLVILSHEIEMLVFGLEKNKSKYETRP